MRASRRLHGRPAIVAVVLFSWLPYMSARCIMALTCNCPPVGSHQAAAHHDKEAPSEEPHAGAGCEAHARKHQTDRAPEPQHVCCELMSQRAIKATIDTEPMPTLAIVSLAPTSIARGNTSVPSASKRTPDATHHPPPYIRFLSLLI